MVGWTASCSENLVWRPGPHADSSEISPGSAETTYFKNLSHHNISLLLRFKAFLPLTVRLPSPSTCSADKKTDNTVLDNAVRAFSLISFFFEKLYQ